jgi:tryptophan synthase alpha chain
VASRIMAHLVAGYPDRNASLEAARGLIDGGCSYLELQFPFSDPTADGPLIQEACDRALKGGFRLGEGFELVAEIHHLASLPIFIMSYANPVVVRGVEAFLAEARGAGAAGVIVPDLPIDADEGLFALAKRQGLHAVPVISPNTSDKRLDLLRPLDLEYAYATLRGGITGAYTEIGAENLSFLRRLGALNLKILAGFGISTFEQVRVLEPHVHAVVAGSVFVREIRGVLERRSIADHGPSSSPGLYEAVRGRMQELTGSLQPTGRPAVAP